MEPAVSRDFEGYLNEIGICGDGTVKYVECVLTDPGFSTRTLDDVCLAATNIACTKFCPKFEYRVF